MDCAWQRPHKGMGGLRAAVAAKAAAAARMQARFRGRVARRQFLENRDRARAAKRRMQAQFSNLKKQLEETGGDGMDLKKIVEDLGQLSSEIDPRDSGLLNQITELKNKVNARRKTFQEILQNLKTEVEAAKGKNPTEITELEKKLKIFSNQVRNDSEFGPQATDLLLTFTSNIEQLKLSQQEKLAELSGQWTALKARDGNENLTDFLNILEQFSKGLNPDLRSELNRLKSEVAKAAERQKEQATTIIKKAQTNKYKLITSFENKKRKIKDIIKLFLEKGIENNPKLAYDELGRLRSIVLDYKKLTETQIQRLSAFSEQEVANLGMRGADVTNKVNLIANIQGREDSLLRSIYGPDERFLSHRMRSLLEFLNKAHLGTGRSRQARNLTVETVQDA